MEENDIAILFKKRLEWLPNLKWNYEATKGVINKSNTPNLKFGIPNMLARVHTSTSPNLISADIGNLKTLSFVYQA